MDRETQIQVGRIKEVIVHKLKNKGLISLYLGGTVPSRDRIPSSDIDTLGIVESNFDFKKEQKVNCCLRGCLKEEIGIYSTFRGVTLSELNRKELSPNGFPLESESSGFLSSNIFGERNLISRSLELRDMSHNKKPKYRLRT